MIPSGTTLLLLGGKVYFVFRYCNSDFFNILSSLSLFFFQFTPFPSFSSDGKPFLAQVDLIGTNYEERIIATGYGSYICTPLLRNALEKNPGLGQEEARKVYNHSFSYNYIAILCSILVLFYILS